MFTRYQDQYDLDHSFDSVDVTKVKDEDQLSSASTTINPSSDSLFDRFINFQFQNRVILILWKNLKLKTRHPWKSLFWMLIPCIFSVIMVLVRMAAEKIYVENPIIYPAHPIGETLRIMGLREKHILYSPQNNITDEIMKIYKSITNVDTYIGFPNESSLVDQYLEWNSNRICCAVIFNQISADKIDFRLRFPFIPTSLQKDYSISRLVELTWKTAKPWPKMIKSGPRTPNNSFGGPPDYFNNGFLYVQHQLSRAVAQYLEPETETFFDKLQMFVQRYPYPPFKRSDFLFYLQMSFPMTFLLSFMSIALELTKDIVVEKELRLKEVMKIMGLKDWMNWCAWFLYSFGWNLIYALVIIAIICVPFDGEAILNYSNPLIILLFTMLYVLAIITYCFLMSTLPKISEKADFSGTISAAVFFLLFLPYYFVQMNYDDIPFEWRLACASSFNINMPLGLIMIARWENRRIGIQWDNLWEKLSPDDPMTFGHVLLMFLVVALMQFLLALYFDAIFPGKYGIAQKWYFVLQPSYWIKKFKCPKQDQDDQQTSTDGTTPPRGIQILNLSKSYDGEKTYAVKDIKLNLKPSQITVLLGHNGAGKTTLMSMLCGLLPPTAGSVYLDGISFRKEMDKVRQNLGICPQFDVLFDHLTVEEHIWFYCKLKNIDDSLIEDEIDVVIKKLDLESKRRHRAKTLSGGMRRKLSVGIALAGGSKFVLLDEATSGMDVSARRFIWDLLISEKANRTILFSTHFMEEADVLGDKIAIIQQGQLKCFGSPYQLRKDFNIGYLFRVSIVKTANKDSIIDVIQEHVAETKLLASTNNEMTFSLPENQSDKFELLFSTLDQNKTEFGVENFGISVSTIEEVFLRANRSLNETLEEFSNGTLKKDLIDKIKHDSLEQSSSLQHFFQIFRSQFQKKIQFLIRSKFPLLAHFVLPALVLIVGILSGQGVVHSLTRSPPLHVNLEPYRKVFATSFWKDDIESEALGKIHLDIISSSANVIANNITSTDIESHAIQYLSDAKITDTGHSNHYYLVSASFAKYEDLWNITVLFNNQAYHSSTISMALVDEALLRFALNRTDFQLSIWNEPFPKKTSDTINAREFDSVFQTHVLSCLQVSLCFLMSSFSMLLVVEKSSNFKFIQKISGLKMYQYWLANFILDYAIYVVSVLTLSLIFYLFNVKAFLALKHQAFMITMFLFSGLACLPFIYLLAYLFKDQYTAYVQIIMILFITSFSAFLTVLLMRIPEFNLYDTSELLDTIFTFLFPIYTVTMSIFSVYDNYVGHDVCFSKISFFNITIDIQQLCQSVKVFDLPGQILYCCKDLCTKNCFRFNENYLSWDSPGVGKYIVGCLFLATVFWTTLTLLESHMGKSLFRFWKIFSKFLTFTKKQVLVNQNSQRKTDNDVEMEEIKISDYPRTQHDQYAMVVKNISKNFGRVQAVRNISFSVERGECFGMLGENGAGKTTTFKMITGATKLTYGNIWINRFNTNDHINEVFKDIGYCPQFNGLLNELTGRETLEIIFRVRGIKEHLIEPQILHLSELLQFSKYIDRIVDEYSGGTKRKLSFAIAIAGNPLITFLDEPTTGIDPLSRQGLWNAIRLVRSGGSSLVLTSHSMEECEALCNRLVIMVSGRIRCIGSPLHLKRKFGTGYIIQIKLSTKLDGSRRSEKLTEDQLQMIQACKEISLKKFMDKNFPSKFESNYENLFTFRILSNDIKLSKMFGIIERNKKRLNIEHYSINQPSLEKIFLSFINQKLRKNSSNLSRRKASLIQRD